MPIDSATPEPPDAFAPARLGPVTLRNRFIKSATFEGMTPGGLPTPSLVEFHRRFAAGGVGLTTLAYCAVSPEGRTFRDQILMDTDVVGPLRVLTDAVHAEDGAIAAQLGHSGWMANRWQTGLPILAPSSMPSVAGMGWAHAMSDADIARVTGDFARAAGLAVDAGFDAIELHLGHGYLLSQFLSPWTNRRRDRHGGSVANRARFPRQVAIAVREAVGDAVAVTAKVNMADGFPRGLELHEGVAVARMLESDGALDALTLSGGFMGRNPIWLMRGDSPSRAMAAAEPNRVRAVGMRLVGPLLLRSRPFEEAYFLPQARQVRASVRMPLALMGGVTSVDTVRQAMAEGFQFVAMARALLREPDIVEKMRQDAVRSSLCIQCNRCLAEMLRDGTRCVFDPPEVAPGA